MASSSELSILVKLVDQASTGLKNVENNVQELGKSTDATSSSTAEMGNVSDNTGSSLLRLAGYAGITATAIGALKYTIDAVKTFASLGEELTNLSLATGLSTQALSIWRYAAETSGQSAQMVEIAYRGMVLAMGRAATGSQETIRAFNSIGLTMGVLKSLSPDDQFRTITSAISSIPDPTLRAQIAMEIFGSRVGLDILPMLNRSYGELADGAQRAGVIMSDSMVSAANKADEKMDELGQSAKGLQLAIGSAFAGIGQDSSGLAARFMQDMTAMVNSLSWFFNALGTGNFTLSEDRSKFISGGSAQSTQSAGPTVIENEISVYIDGEKVTDQNFARIIEKTNQYYERNGFSAGK